MPSFKTTSIAVGLLSTALSGLLLAEAPAPASEEPALQEIVVTGLRASLEKSLEVKRDAAIVVDSISAEELGRFPDADVADSLQHLPGITISRTTGGEGEKITVRGFGPQYNIVTLNGRQLATDDDGRDLAFDVLPSEVIAAADVLKTSEASALEGSIGGTVNLRTASAFDHLGLHGGVHAEGNYNDMSHLKGDKFSAFLTDTLFDDKIGVLLGAVYSDQKIRTDSLNAYTQNIYGSSDTTVYPLAPNGYSVGPCCITFGSVFDEKKRTALTGALEFRPTDTLKIVLDGLWTHLQDPQIGYNQSDYVAYSTDSNGNPTWSNPTVNNGLVTSVTSSNFTPEIVNNTTNRNVTTSLYGLKVAWEPTDRLSFVADAYRSAAYRPEGGQDTFVTAGLVSQTPLSPDIITITDTPHGFPNLNVSVPPSQLGLSACPAGSASATNAGYCSYNTLMNSGFLNNNKYWSTHYDGLNGYSVHDQVTGFSLDGAWKANLGVFRKVEFGVNETYRVKSRSDISNDWDNGSNQYGTLYQTAGCPVQCTAYDFASQGANVISFNTVPNFLKGAGGSFPSVLPQLNVAQLFSFLRSLDGKPNPAVCTALPCDTVFNFSQTLPRVNPFNSYSVRERTTAAYLELIFGDGDIWAGNLGVRVVHTSTNALTTQSVPVSLWTLSTANSTQSYNVQYSAGTAFAQNASYTYALPSLNVSYWAIPKELQLRAAVGETLSRPDLNQLAPNSTNNAINGTPDLIYSGAAGLKPIKAWAADLSAEWYYHPHSALTAAAFFKKVTNDIYTGVTSNVDLGTVQYVGGPPGTVPGTPFLWNVTAPANGASESYKGVELSWQHFLDMGLGTHMQVTHTLTSGGAVNQAPPTTFSVSLIYDKGPFNADVNWDWTARYTYACAQCTEVPSWPAIQDPFSWVTASLHYRFFEGLEVYVEGKNLSNSIPHTYLNGNPLLPWAPGQSIGQSSSGVGAGYSAYGRTYVLGASYRF